MTDAQDRLQLIAGILFVFRVLIFITLFFLPLHLKNIGFSGWEIGILMAVDSLTSLLTTLPIGISNDLIASRRLVVGSFLALACTYFMLAEATGFFVLMALFILLGSCNSLAQISLKSLIYKTAETARKGGRFSIMGFAEHAGIALGALVGGLLLLKLNYSMIFRITGGLFLLIVPLVLALPKTMTHIFDPATYKKELFKREVIIFTLITFLYTYHWGAEKTVYALFLRDALCFTQTEIGVLIGVTVMVLALACLLCGRLLDMNLTSLSRLIVIGLCLSAAGNMLLALATGTVQAYVFRTVHEIGDASFMMFSYVMTSNLFSRSRVGGGSGFVSQIAVLGTFAGALTSGMLLQYAGPRLPMIVAGALSLAALYCFKKLRLATGAVLEHTPEQSS
jgi:DHA1 family quinolone resistance protein-like MFS transporter